jgi:predicted secreted protein
MQTEGILLNPNFPNTLKTGGEIAWFSREVNPSTGYTWKFRPDNSGVYKEMETILLHSSTGVPGTPGEELWKFKAMKPGKGSMRFERFPPGADNPDQTLTINVQVM